MPPSRKRAQKSYKDNFSDEELEKPSKRVIVNNKESVDESSGDLVVEKVLGRKFINKKDDCDEKDELFLIKWRGMSFLHVTWELREDIERVDHQGKVKIKRFLTAEHPAEIFGIVSKSDDDDEIEYFQSDLVEVQRVIACDAAASQLSTCTSLDEFEVMMDNCDDEELDVRYLVKWRGLPYAECSWEYCKDIKYSSEEIFRFWKRQRPSVNISKGFQSPSIQDYQRLATSPSFGGDEMTLTLREYQLEGVNWLLWNWWHKRPCILADEMGLGKTIQTVGFLHQLMNLPKTKLRGPFLVVAPLSLINQWYNEISLWSPHMNCLVLHGSQESRDMILTHEFYYSEPYNTKQEVNQYKKKGLYKFNVILTTFEMIIRDLKVFSRIDWEVLIVDEAHRLKNSSSRVFEYLSSVSRNHCVLLTGTPLQNKTEELWALLNFADKSKFSNLPEFIMKFGDLRDSTDVASLHSVLKPYLLRRVKEDVEKSLPPKEETIIEVSLTSLQKQFYRAIYERNLQFLFKGAKNSNQPSLMNVMMELRKCCNHPFLTRGVEDKLQSEIPIEQRTDEKLHQQMVECSGKMMLLNKLLPRLFAEGHKVLIFSQMVRVLNILEDFLRYKGYVYERLDGSTRNQDRTHAVERFCKPSMNRFIMLLSTKAGGLGLNLTAADTVIIFDSDWNPHNDIQAQARAHRIGQTKAVMVYRLLTRKTYEMHMFHRASLKLGLDKAVLAHARNEQDGDAGDDIGPTSNDKSVLQAKEIDELLKRGAYDVFRDDDTEQNDFVEADIDQIMERSAHKINYDSLTANSMCATLGGFSKATFVSADEKEDIDINDPDFWKKAIGFEEPVVVVDEFDVPTQPRQRKQTKVFGSSGDTNELEELLAEVGQLESPMIDELLKSKKLTKEEREEMLKLKKELLKDKREKDKLKKAALNEMKAKDMKDSKLWGSHTRDRLLRSLLFYGFGRWEKIRSESGAGHRDLVEIETFARSYVMQCGLTAGDSDASSGRLESPFVLEAISAAKAVDALVKAGVRSLEIPPVLTEEKFVLKLKQGGGKKSLNKLGLLSKLFIMIGEAADKLYAELFPGVTRSADLDVALAGVDAKVLAKYLPLGDMRPTWTRPRHWWDDMCDRHLLVGVYKHGFGKYAEIRDDVEFIFHTHVKDIPIHGFRNSALKGLPNSIDSEDAALKKDGKLSVSPENVTASYLRLGNKEVRLMLTLIRESKYRGVYSQPGSVKWLVQYGDGENVNFLGCFDTEIQGAIAYDEIVIRHNQHAQTNFDQITGEYNEPLPDEVPIKRPALPWHRASKYRGVRASGSRWTSQISYDGGNHHLGTFSTEIEAAIAYERAAIDHHGPSGASNFPDGVEGELRKLGEERGVTVEFLDIEGNVIEVISEGKREVFASTLVNQSDDNMSILDRRGIENYSSNFSLQKSTNRDYNDDTNENDPSTMEQDDADNENDNDMENYQDGDNDNPDALEAGDAGGDEELENEYDLKSLGPVKSLSTSSSLKDRLDVDMGLPDARILNRLFTWLVSSDGARMSRLDVESKVKKLKALKKAKSIESALKKGEQARSVALEDMKKCIEIGEIGVLVLYEEYFHKHDCFNAMRKLLLKKYENILLAGSTIHANYNDDNVNAPRSLISNSFADNDQIGNLEDDNSMEVKIEFDDISSVNNVESNHAVKNMHFISELPIPESVRNQFTDEESDRIVCGLLVYGAPIENAINPSGGDERAAGDVDWCHYDSFGMSSKEGAKEGGCSKYSWSQFLHYCRIESKTEVEVEFFYKTVWLPFCIVACKSSYGFASKINVPNPFYSLSQHYPSVRNMCSFFMYKQRIAHAIRYVLQDQFDGLIMHLKQHSDRYILNMPVWWCPWIHDVALLVGIMKHGYLKLDCICKDSTLPFTQENIQLFIRRVFIYGSGTENILPASHGVIHDVHEANHFVEYASMLFPDLYKLECKVYKILHEMTRSLPPIHYCRIPLQAEIDAADSSSLGATECSGKDHKEGKHAATASVNLSTFSSSKITRIDAGVSRMCFLPTLPLSRFVRESAKRRRLSLCQKHGHVLDAIKGMAMIHESIVVGTKSVCDMEVSN